MEIIIVILLLLVMVLLVVLLKQNHHDHLSIQLQDVQKNQAKVGVYMDHIEDYLYQMNQVMVNHKSRGNWGEYQLDALLSLYCGNNKGVYETQYQLSNHKIVDAALHFPGSNKVLCIDAKFPLDNYNKVLEDENYLRAFKNDIKKHVDDISNKYINDETMAYAMMFIPSEAIFQYICANCDDLFTYSLQKSVMLVSPTTLVAQVMTLLETTKDLYRNDHIDQIKQDILTLNEDARRLQERSAKAEKTLESLKDQFHMISISAKKLADRMDKMERRDEDDNDDQR